MSFRAYRSAEEWRREMGETRAAAAVGNFDGVHCGHQEILRRVVERTRATGGKALALTFDPHPSRVLRPESAPPLITTVEQRLELFAAAGLDAALVLPFTAAFARLTPEQFALEILLETIHAEAVYVGDNFRFGHRQEGDPALLADLGSRLGFDVETVPAVRRRGVLVSSTLVRRAVAEGEVERAGRMLGRPFSLSGEIQPGTGQGRRVVVPTLNLAFVQELVPARGVYATEALLNGETHRAATNVGLRPTFDGHTLTVESHLLDFSRMLTGGPMEVRFWKRLRDERKFASVAELRAQVLADVERTRRFFDRLDRRRRPAAAS